MDVAGIQFQFKSVPHTYEQIYEIGDLQQLFYYIKHTKHARDMRKLWRRLQIHYNMQTLLKNISRMLIRAIIHRRFKGTHR